MFSTFRTNRPYPPARFSTKARFVLEFAVAICRTFIGPRSRTRNRHVPLYLAVRRLLKSRISDCSAHDAFRSSATIEEFLRETRTLIEEHRAAANHLPTIARMCEDLAIFCDRQAKHYNLPQPT